MTDLVIRNGSLVSAQGLSAADVAIADGRIVAIGAGVARDGAAAIDARGLLVLPGLIDVHVHFREPGLEHEEDWQSGTRAAIHGGVTTVLDMPNTVPVTATADAARAKLALAQRSAHCDFGLYGLLGEAREDVAELAASGLVVGFKAFLGPTTGAIPSPTDDVLRAGLAAASKAGLRVAFHAEDADLVERATAAVHAAGRTEPRAHLDARPAQAEVASIDRVGQLLAETGAAGHVAHVSSAEGLTAIERWRARGADISCELTPHHALLDTDAYKRWAGLAKVNPPIRSAPHAATLLAALAAGAIDCVASDHAPHVAADKQRPSVWDVPAGFAGVETLLRLMLTEVAAGRLEIEALVRATSERPARAFGLWPLKGALAAGSDADLVLVDPARERAIRAVELHGKNNHSPWEGRRTVGLPVATIVRGRVVMRDGETLGAPGWGRHVSRAG